MYLMFVVALVERKKKTFVIVIFFLHMTQYTTYSMTSLRHGEGGGKKVKAAFLLKGQKRAASCCSFRVERTPQQPCNVEIRHHCTCSFKVGGRWRYNEAQFHPKCSVSFTESPRPLPPTVPRGSCCLQNSPSQCKK